MCIRLRLLTTISVGMALLLAGGCGTDEGAAAEEPSAAIRNAPVSVIEVHRRDLSRRLSLSANVQPRVQVGLAARTAGTVRALHAETGDRVEEGTVLVELDTAEQEAELARARAQLAEARANLGRATRMHARQLLSEADFQAAEAQVAMAQSDAALWRARVDFGRIAAPMDATVVARHVEPGEAVNPQQVLLQLADLEDLVVNLGVSELDVVHLAAGEVVPVRFDALPGRVLDAQIRRIFPTADADSRLVTVELALPTDAWERGVRPGYLARIDTLIDRHEDVIALPSAAVATEAGERYVFVVEDSQLQRRAVTPGVQRGDLIEIADGLREGEVVLATSPLEMSDGQGVRIIHRQGAR